MSFAGRNSNSNSVKLVFLSDVLLMLVSTNLIIHIIHITDFEFNFNNELNDSTTRCMIVIFLHCCSVYFLAVSLGFFDDIHVPEHLLQQPSKL